MEKRRKKKVQIKREANEKKRPKKDRVWKKCVKIRCKKEEDKCMV